MPADRSEAQYRAHARTDDDRRDIIDYAMSHGVPAAADFADVTRAAVWDWIAPSAPVRLRASSPHRLTRTSTARGALTALRWTAATLAQRLTGRQHSGLTSWPSTRARFFSTELFTKTEGNHYEDPARPRRH